MNAAHPLFSRLNDPTLLRTDALIGSDWTSGQRRFEVCDPANGRLISTVANLGRDETLAAITCADRAGVAWRRTTAKERGAVLMRWYALMVQHVDDLASILTAEQGKPLADARVEVIFGASFAEWFAEEGRRAYGETIPTNDADKRFLVMRQPVGVCAAITPWNFPISMITRKVAPALAAGCTVVIKPAEATPLSALAVAELARRAGMPDGVLNVVTGDSSASIEIGKALCDSPIVRHLSFTGSTEVGRILMRQCAPTVKKLALELGGNAPFIVFDDADLDSAIEGAMASKFRNAGQTCVCANRLYVQKGVYDAFVERLAVKTGELRLGHGYEAGVHIGPLIDAQSVSKVESHIADAVKRGARLLVGGAPAGIANKSLGPNFFQPTVLADVSRDSLCAREETFGPLAPVLRFETEEEVLALANATEYGLASYCYSRDFGRVFRVAEALEYGMVAVNTGLISAAEVPFGGIKQSGIGREGSRHGLDEYLELKYVCLAGMIAR